MARNWDKAGAGGLGTLIDAFKAGQDRSRGIAKEKADSQREGSQWAFTNTKNYQKPKTDEYGFVTGYEGNQDTRNRNTPILKNLKPEYFRDPPEFATPPIVAPGSRQPQAPEQAPEQDFTKEPNQELSPSGRPMGKTYEDSANREPQGKPSRDPEPLLIDPKAKQVEAQLQSQERQNSAALDSKGKIEEKKLASGRRALVGAGTKSVQYDPNDPGQPGVDPSGKPVRMVDAMKTVQQIDKPMEVLGGANASQTDVIPGQQPQATAVAPNQYDPDDYMMGRITDLATTPAARAMEQMVSIGSLPPALLKGTSLEGFKGQMPASIFRAILSGEYGLKRAGMTGANAVLPPEATPYLSAIESGQITPGDAMEAYQADVGPVPKAVSDAFYKRENAKFRQQGQDDANARADKVTGRVEKGKYMDMVGKASDQWKKGADEILSETQFARNAKAMANSGDTRGMVGAIRNMLARASSEKGPLSVYDVKQFGGEEGWAEQLEQIIARGSNEGMTPANIKVVNRLADIYIKAAQKKAQHLSIPIIGGLRARAKAYGMDPDEAEELFRSEMSFDLGSEDMSGAAPSAPPPAAPPAGDLKSKYEAALKEADKITNPSERRKAKARMTERYKAMGGE